MIKEVAIKALRQLDLSAEEIKSYLNGIPLKKVLQAKEAELKRKQTDISIQLSIIKYLKEDKKRKYQAVTKAGIENERIIFRTLPATKAICIYHRGDYNQLGDADAYIMSYANTNGYKTDGLARECYIDGIWNKNNAEDCLTEIQLPIETD